MTQNQTYKAIEKALRSYRIAESELNRPNEDSVTLCACQCSRNSIDEFFKAFLIGNSFDADFKMKSVELLDECRKLDSEFSAINLSSFVCKHDAEACDKHYCLSIEKVNECFETTRLVKELVLSRLKISEKDFESSI